MKLKEFEPYEKILRQKIEKVIFESLSDKTYLEGLSLLESGPLRREISSLIRSIKISQ